MKKVCTKCGEEKELELFVKNKQCKNGYAGTCKLCFSEYSANWYQKNKNRLKPIRKEWAKINKEKIKIKDKIYYYNNKEKILKYSADWYQKNKKRIIKKELKRKKTDPIYKMQCNLRTLIGHMIRKGGYSKKSKTIKILGCSYEEFKQHLESQFQEGMTWDNYGRNGWHIDHIYPVSRARDEQHLLELNHYTNLQPLWEKDNIAKGNKLDWGE